MTELVRRTTLTLQAGEGPLALLVALAAFALLAWLGARSTGGAHGRQRVVLAALRTLLAAAVVLLALRPALRRERLAVSASPVAVIVDASASMAMAGAADGVTRLQRVARWLNEREREITRLEASAAVTWHASSGGGLRPTSRDDVAAGRLVAAGGTDLAGTLAALADQHPGRRRPAVILFSDGADHGRLAATVDAGGDVRALLAPGAPVLAIAPAGGVPRNVALRILAHDPVGFLRTDVTLRVGVTAEGLEAADLPVSLLAGEEVLAVRTVRVGGREGGETEVTFTLRPGEVGEELRRVSVPVQPGESVVEDNAADFSVRVVRDRLRVLQVVGRPSWDGRFLREVLKRNPAVDLVSFFILRSAWDDTGAEIEELSLIPFPVSTLFTEKLEGFDLVVFQNFDPGPYAIAPLLRHLVRHVEDNGAGFCVIGGDLAFGADYRSSDLARLLPVELGPRTSWSSAPFRAEATPAGARHPALWVSAEPGAPDPIAGLLRLSGLSTGLSPREGAQVLLETGDARRAPVLVAGEAGKGRVLLLATDGLWRWSLPSAGRPAGARAYEAAWEAALRWLVRDPRTASLVLDADRRTVGSGESVALRATLRRPGAPAPSGEPVEFLVRGPGDEVPVSTTVTTGEDGVARLAVDPDRAGFHEIRVRALGATAGPLYVRREDEGRELSDPRLRLDVLEALAKATGGAVRGEDEPGLDLPFEAARDERLEGVTLVPLWSTWPAWALVGGLACVEWWLRRRWGLA